MKYAFGNIREVEERKMKEWDEMRYREFIISSSVKDRHRTVVNVDKWDLTRYALNPIVGYMHDVYGGRMCSPDDPDTLIGTSKVWIEEGKVSEKLPEGRYLMGGVTFETEDVNPLAEKIFKKVKSGSLRMTSVGFMELGTGKYGEGDERQGGKDETYYFEGQELLEWSIVKIPSNSTAVARTITNQADWALAYILKYMPENVSMKDIKKMSVQQVLDLISKGVEGNPKKMMMPGDKVMAKKGKEHHPDHEGMVMTIQEMGTHALSVKTEDGATHRWYVEDELEPVEEMPMDKAMVKKKLGMRVAIMKHELNLI